MLLVQITVHYICAVCNWSDTMVAADALCYTGVP